ncbi:MAG TPA: TerC family protein [Planctomycetota bacterium]|nr:TerC family protein [Planctomycetota bacterium]
MLLSADHVGVGSPALWVGFSVFVVALLALDLGVLNRKAHAPSLGEAARWTALWVGIAAAFNVFVYVRFGHEKGAEFTAGYVVEEALSIDNLFVFLVLFRSLAVPAAYQHRVLFWGILGALVTRGIFILVGSALLDRFHWMIFVFGGFLVITGGKLLFAGEVEPHPEKNIIARMFRRIFPMTADYHGGNFFVHEDGRRKATPLLLAVVAAEATDVLFATDSIPAVFAISRDPFIVYTSNIFAILGLRSLYFLLAGIMDRFHYLKYGLAFVLIFVGGKMLLGESYEVPVLWSLAVILGLLAISIVASLLRPRPPASGH